jgi:O-antigen/teichoic acid export membrane protein
MSLRRNTIWSLAGAAVPLLAAALLIPSTLHQLGNEAFGVLTLIWALIGYFSLFDMGMGRALTFELARLREANVPLEISLTLKAGLLITLIAGLVGALVMLTLAPHLAQDWLKISPGLSQDAMLSFQIAAVGVIPTTVTSGLRGALEGLGNFALSNINRMALGVGMFVLPALVLATHGQQLWVITLYLVAARFVVAIAALFTLRNYFSFSSAGLRSRLKPLAHFGFWATITGIVSPLMVIGDRFFVSAIVGASLLPLYAIPQEAMQRLLILPAALCAALLPQLSAMTPQAAAPHFRRHYRRVAVWMFVVCALVALGAYPAMAWWLSDDFARQAFPIVLVLALGVWLNATAFVPYTLLHANGNTRLTALFHLFELCLYLIALFLLTPRFGLVGAAIVWTGRVALDLLLLHNAANKLLRSGP